MLFIYPTPKFPRTPLEATLKSFYTIALAATGVGAICLFADYISLLENSMPWFYSHKNTALAPSLAFVLKNCTYPAEISILHGKATLLIDEDMVRFGLLQCAQYIVALFSLGVVSLFANIIALGMYKSGQRHIRVFGVHISLYHALVGFCYFINFVIIGVTFSYYYPCDMYNKAVRYCAGKAVIDDPDGFYESEYAGFTIFSAVVLLPMITACVNVLVYLVAFVVRCYQSNHRVTVLLSEADVPWEERGVLCRTRNALLRLHTTQRNAIIKEANEALKDGIKIRLVRSYQLVTEEDYQQIVEDMRLQVEEYTKKEQFDILRRNLGEDEAAWDMAGLQWRDQLPWRVSRGRMSEDEEDDPERGGPLGPVRQDNRPSINRFGGEESRNEALTTPQGFDDNEEDIFLSRNMQDDGDSNADSNRTELHEARALRRGRRQRTYKEDEADELSWPS